MTSVDRGPGARAPSFWRDLMRSQRIGCYSVTAKIGEGGIGEVDRAHDATLDRDVAIKVLSDAFASDPERLARFEREAKVLASLNHPNIGHIYGLEESGDTRALVLELVEGPTLADRIKQGPSPSGLGAIVSINLSRAPGHAARHTGLFHGEADFGARPATRACQPGAMGTVRRKCGTSPPQRAAGSCSARTSRSGASGWTSRSTCRCSTRCGASRRRKTRRPFAGRSDAGRLRPTGRAPGIAGLRAASPDDLPRVLPAAVNPYNRL